MQGTKLIAKNKKARFDYEIIKTMEAGIVLTGNEIKSIRLGHVNLKDSFAKINFNNEVILSNLHITNYAHSHIVSIRDERSPRKLLLHKREIMKLKHEIDTNRYTLVPLSLYFKGSLVKVELALCKGKKVHDKRQAIKERDVKREMDKEIKKRIKI